MQGTGSIGALACAAGVTVEAVRFYQRKGLLVVPPRPAGGIRRYTETDAARLRFIKSAQRLGFRLDEVAQLLQLQDGTHCNEAAEVAGARLADVRRRLAALQRMEQALAGLLQACDRHAGDLHCPLIEALHANAQVL